MRKYTIESAIYPVIRVIFRDIRLKKVSLEIEVSGGLWFLLKKHPVHTLNVYALIGIGSNYNFFGSGIDIGFNRYIGFSGNVVAGIWL